MIKDAVAQIHPRRQRAAIVQVFVHRVATGKHHAGNENLIADLERADFVLGERSGQMNHTHGAA